VRWAIGVIALTAVLVTSGTAAASQSLTYQQDAAHTGATTEPGLDPPFARRWAVDLGQPTSYPVIAGGRVFVVARNESTYGTQLFALDARDGRTLWQKALGGSYYWSGIAYGAGRVYAVNGAGLMAALDPATGAQNWSRQLGQYSFSSEPSFSDGTVYVGGAGSGGTLYSLDAATGGVRWSASVCCGDHSSPAIADGRVHVGYACHNDYGFGAATGTLLWNSNDGCSGGGGATTVVSGGRVYARDLAAGKIHDAASGAVVGAFTSTTAPAISGAEAYTQRDGTLEALAVPAMTVRWSFSDGGMSIAPIVVNGAVIAGSTTGRVYALDRGTGRTLWCDDVGRPISGPDEHNVSEPVVGLGAGEGLLVVPASGLLVGYGAGRGGGCAPAAAPAPTAPAAPGAPGAPAVPGAPAGPRLTLSVGKRHLFLGQRTRIHGRLSGVADVSRRRVALEVDEWPFKTFRRVVRTRTDAHGRFAFIARPPRNVRVRARFKTLRSRARTLWADFPYRVRVRGAGTRRPRLDYTVYAFRGAKIRDRRVYAYLAHGRTEPWSLVAGRRWQRKGRRSVAVSFRYPRGRLGKGDHWMVCVPEPTPDAFGRPTEIERVCGQREIPRGT
jgi:outer membrane protein assembly factor BamB